MDGKNIPQVESKYCLETISKQISGFLVAHRSYGPLSLRRALGVSLDAMAGLLSNYLGGQVYNRSTINTWERRERGAKLPARYEMPVKVRTAYLLLLGDVVEMAGRGRGRLRARMGQRVWHFGLERDCVSCGRPFRMRRSDAARCRRCLRNGKP